MAIERKACFQAKRVPCTKADGCGPLGQKQIPQHQAVVPAGKELEAEGLTRISCAGYLHFRAFDRYSAYGISNWLRQWAGLDDLPQKFTRHGPLKRKHNQLFGVVYQLNIVEVLQKRLQVFPVLLAVSRIDHQEILSLDEAIKIGIVHCTACFVGD